MLDFVHLHNHTHFSLLDAACTTDQLIKAAVADQNRAIALTDHGVMYGCYEFYKKCHKNSIKPILGFEAYVAKGSRFDRNTDKTKSKKGQYYHLVLLAKDFTGYKNLMKLTSLGHTEGFYYRPRIDKELLEKYHEGVIATSACLGGVVSKPIADGEYELAVEQAQYYKDLFGDDFYIEIQDHGLEKDPIVLQQAPEIAKKLGIKIVATNDIHYIKKEHAIAHNILLMINKENSNSSAELPDITKLRYGTPEYYFKTREEMNELFKAFPDAIANTIEIADKCDVQIEKKLYMPIFPIPKESKAETLDDYFEELAWDGFKDKYPNSTEEEVERLKYELKVIRDMGFPGYFLIVQDFVNAAKFQLGVSVGPGRGSAAGSMVAFCLGITNVDPMPYDLLFERFLNPERVSMPDIDIDFADTKRERVIEYVKQKYGPESVSQIITFGKLSCKAVLKDVGRVLGIHHSIINQITAKIPVSQGKVTPLVEALELPDLKEFKDDKDPQMVKLKEYSILLEGFYRHSSVHAAGVVIAPAEVSNFVPLVKKEAEMVSQFAGGDLEDAGLLKMDFLGLRTLTIIDDTLELIKKNFDKEIDIDKIDFSDDLTYDLFSAGQTLAIFQFESKGMQEYLMQLKPRNLEEITAMNALYRPGPMDNIPEFIDRKFGRNPISYIHPIMEKALTSTYGIIVYQEQVMQLVRDVAGFSLGQADILRRAMGKKKQELMDEQKPLFAEGAAKKGVSKAQADEIFDLIQKFAKYGFNKSHALAYSYLAYQTAWLKANYPAQFLAANMTAEMNSLDKIVQLIDEAENKGIKVLPPDVNRSIDKFTVVNNQIYFGMAAIKNVGFGAVESIVQARTEKPFTSFFDFVARVDTRQINKRVIEALICSGAFDTINPHRASLMEAVEASLNYAKALQNVDTSMTSLFGGTDSENIPEPRLPDVKDWKDQERLDKEKEYLNFYVSGHPLDQYKHFIKPLSALSFSDTESPLIGHQARICGLISSIRTRLDKRNNTIAFLELEDFTGKGEIILWSDSYQKYSKYLQENTCIVVIGKADLDNEKIKIVTDQIIPIEEAAKTMLRGYSIWIHTKDFDDTKLDKLKAVANIRDGKASILFNLVYPDKPEPRKWLASNVNIDFSFDSFNKVAEIFGKQNINLVV
jgi:DNA polymerase-3 subunit alpha